MQNKQKTRPEAGFPPIVGLVLAFGYKLRKHKNLHVDTKRCHALLDIEKVLGDVFLGDAHAEEWSFVVSSREGIDARANPGYDHILRVGCVFECRAKLLIPVHEVTLIKSVHFNIWHHCLQLLNPNNLKHECSKKAKYRTHNHGCAKCNQSLSFMESATTLYLNFRSARQDFYLVLSFLCVYQCALSPLVGGARHFCEAHTLCKIIIFIKISCNIIMKL